jgi:hypothetical protein
MPLRRHDEWRPSSTIADLGTGRKSASCPGRFTSRETAPGSQTSLDAVEKRKIFAAASIFMVREDEGNTYI